MKKELTVLEKMLKLESMLENIRLDIPIWELFDDIKQALTPPTADEVCKALSEWTTHKITFETNVFWFNHHNTILGWQKEPITQDFMNYDGKMIYKIIRALPPHLITMISRFYEQTR